MTFWAFLALIAVVIGVGIVLYNRLVRVRQLADEGWSGIDVQLKRRADLIPNLVTTVKGYAAHENQLLEQVTALRAKATMLPEGDVAGRGKVETRLSVAIGRLMALAENYPDLKASENFLELQKALAAVENDIQMARRYYNGAARNLNVQIESFPSNLVAGLFGFRERDFFEIGAADRAVPDVDFDRSAS
ncbi:LemA family protein [Bauldia sp.]|uniref:LemA family protein n=1 Tax=Bauldia sp. TaxID=2575872 RepID=UPI003BAA828D